MEKMLVQQKERHISTICCVSHL